MIEQPTADPTQIAESPAVGTPWLAVACLSLMTFALIASEFMPVSLLSPIAADLAIDLSPGNWIVLRWSFPR